ncbi:MAG: glycerol-3-phosphate 1-O-acyltransferase PlsY [Bacteroidales bacterium]|nr:glycerol-3-phosphate 1-O-acyltransferase PlsY [Bacteroidales bacterium]
MWYMILGVVIAYLLGSISFAVWIGRIFYKVDVREHGSGNAGTTNTIRVLGWMPGLFVLLLDAFKGWLAIHIGDGLMPDCYAGWQEYYDVLLAVSVLLGHIFPLFTGFKGGKGVATMVGIVIALYPEAFLGAFAVFMLVFLLTHYVSLASILASIVFPVLDIFVFHQEHVVLMVFAILVPLLIILTHRKNIGRLLRGEESKMYIWKKS